MGKKKIVIIYKKFISFLFKLKYGQIKNIIKKSNNINIFKIRKEKKILTFYQINNCRIYTDTIHNTAFIHNNAIVDGASFQLRNFVNSNIKNNKVLTQGTPRILKKIPGFTLSILTGGGGNNNYWHWLFDVLPRIGLVEKKFSLKSFNHVLVPNNQYKFQIETLKILKIYHKSLPSKKYKHIYSDSVITTTHPWQHSNSAHKDIGNIPKWVSVWLRKKFINYKSKKKFFKKIYIDRSDSELDRSNNRQIVNEHEIKKILKEKKFQFIKLSEYSFKDQIAIFNDAKIIVGNHGAGFANIVFSKKKTIIIEFIDKNTPTTFKKISKDLNLNYKFIKGKRIGRDLGNINNNLKISKNILTKILNKY